jgi:hypothetical protein
MDDERRVSRALAEEYVQYHLKAGVANATINRELATLIRMLRLGYERDKLAKLPRIHKLTEAPPRAGFFERSDLEAVRCSYGQIYNAPSQLPTPTDRACNLRCWP